MAFHLHRLGALAALGLIVMVGPPASAAADKDAAAASAPASSAEAKSPGRGGLVAPPARRSSAPT
jgi:hypothetical protein